MTPATESMLGKTPLLMLIDGPRPGPPRLSRVPRAAARPKHRRGGLGGIRLPQHAAPGQGGLATHALRHRIRPSRSHIPARRVRRVQSAPASHAARAQAAVRPRPPTRRRVRHPHLRDRGLRGRRRAGHAVQAGREPRDRDDRTLRGQRPASARDADGAGRAGLHRQGRTADLRRGRGEGALRRPRTEAGARHQGHTGRHVG